MRKGIAPLDLGEERDAEEAALVAIGLMRLPLQPKSNGFLDLPAPEVSLESLRAVIRAEREEDEARFLVAVSERSNDLA